jgi:Domain of unknown function (DUF4386)
MTTQRKTAIVVGVLYFVGTVAGILSLVFTGPIQSSQDYLVSLPGHEHQLIVGAFFVLVMGLALAMVPVMMFPILKKYNEALALGYVVFRGGLEAVSYLAIVISWLLLLPLRQVYLQAGVSGASQFQALGSFLLAAKEIGYLTTIVFCLGALMFYTLLYQSRLVPRWLSGWGLMATLPYLLTGLLAMFAALTPLSPLYIASKLPLALQEMVLAVWLIVKGFNSSALTLESAKTAIN